MRQRLRIFLTAPAVGGAVMLAACSVGNVGRGAASTSATASSHSASTAAVLGVGSSGLGPMLVDGHGRTIYVFTADRPGTPACVGACLADWPIVAASTAPQAPAGSTAQLGAVTRPDGARQLTVDGSPAYTSTADTAAGSTSGEGVRLGSGVFLAVAPSGLPLNQATPTTAAPAPPPQAAPTPTRAVPPPVMTRPPSTRVNPGDGDGDNRGGADDGDGRV